MFAAIAIVAGILLAALLGYAATRPDSFRVRRTVAAQAPPEKIFDLIHDFHRWRSWSPYEKLDPAMKRTYSGASSGPGAVYAWEGNSKAGAGRMEITGAVPRSSVTIKLDFIKPFEGHNTAEFTMEAQDAVTRVTWAMHGPQAYAIKVMSIFCSMDRMIGKDFEAGLANIKNLAEDDAGIESGAICN